jgi:hypothetical protein
MIMRYATFNRNIDKSHPTAIGLESELRRLFLPRALLSMQIQTCTNSIATRLHHDATFNVIAVLRIASLCTYAGVGQLRDISLKRRYRGYLATLAQITLPLSKKRVGPTSSMPSSSRSLTSFFFSIRVPHMAASGHSAVHSRRYGLYSFTEWIPDRHRVR